MNTFGKYQVLEELGTGAAGVTYHARDAFRNRELALKVLHASATTNGELRERLAAAAELRHSHIAAVCDLGEVDGAIYIASELLAGDGLDRHFRERRVLPLPQKLKLIAQVSEALTYAHSKGVAHGNLKPSNIFVVGKDAKILDFGLAGAVASPFPNYLAPEQALGQPLDARSDVFSCAVILYELLVDAYPFQGPAGLIPRQIVHSEPAPLRSLDPRIPDELDQLLAHALKKNPQHRLETADQFASALYTIARDFQNGRPSRPAPRPSQPAPAQPPAAPEPTIDSELPTAFARPAPAPVTESAPTRIPVAPAPSPSPSVSYVAVHAPVPIPVPVPIPREVPVTAAPVPATQKRKFRRARVIVYASAAVLTICIAVSLLSRQSIRASQANHAPAASPKISLHTETRSQAAAPSPSASPDVRGTPDTKPAAGQPSLDRGSLDQVKSLWESGRYGQATELVNAILAANPANTEARAWRKKIRAAQQAEAGMK